MRKALAIWSVTLLWAGASWGRTVSVTGTVVDEQSHPIAGAKVCIYEMAGESGLASGYQEHMLQESTTAADGAFAFAASNTGNRREIMIVAMREGLALGWDSWNGRKDQQRDVMLTQPQQLRGVIVDSDGHGVADATVFIAIGRIGVSVEEQRYLFGSVSRRLLNVRTDGSGQFILDGLPANGRFELGVEKPGFAMTTTFNRKSGSSMLTYSPGQADIRLVMPPEARIDGKVIRPDDGRPVDGVPIALSGDRTVAYFLPNPVLSQEDGTFAFAGLPPDKYTISVATPDAEMSEWVSPPVQMVLEAGQTDRDVTVEVGKGAVVELMVTDDASGQPIEGVTVSTQQVQSGQRFRADSNVDGVVRLRLPPGGYSPATVTKTGYVHIGGGPSLTVVAGRDQHLELSLERLPGITGVLRDPEGRPVAGALVSVLPIGRNEATSDAAGRYELSWDPSAWGLEGTTFCLLVRHVERNLAAAVEMAADTQSLDVVLEPATALSGKVIGSDNHPLTDARIVPMLRVSSWGSSILSAEASPKADGSFVIDCLPRNHEYDINVRADGYGTVSQDVEVELTQAEHGDVGAVTLPVATLSVSGQVVDVDGRPMAGMHVSTLGFKGQPDVREVSDAEGRFTLTGLCPGKVNLMANGTVAGKTVSGRILAYGGATGIRIVVREGQQVPIQYHSGKTYDQILAESKRVIAGVVVDENGTPVRGVPVGVCSLTRGRGNGRVGRLYSSFPTMKATTDEQGRFAIAAEEDREFDGCDLLFSPDNHAADIIYDVPVNTKDLKVILTAGGTIEGTLMRLEGVQKVPIPNAQVKLEQTSRAAFTYLGFDRDRTTLTDAQGRFRFEHIQTGMRGTSEVQEAAEWTPVPRVWQLVYGGLTETFAFYDRPKIEDFELLVKPAIDDMRPLTGQPLPAFEGIDLGLTPDQMAGKAVLICFFDYQQRPSRNTLVQLARQAESLTQQGVVILGIQASHAEQAELDAWTKQSGVAFPVARITADVEATRAVWLVKSLPWLILADADHEVVAEGFAIGELDTQLSQIGQ